MADLHRLVVLFLAALCVMCAGRSVHAQTGGTYSSRVAAQSAADADGQAWVSARNSDNAACVAASNSPSTCGASNPRYTVTDEAPATFRLRLNRYVSSSPASGSVEAQTGVLYYVYPACPAGTKYNPQGQCVSDVCGALKGFTDFVTFTGRQAAGSTQCIDTGCSVALSSTLIYVQDKATGAWSTKGDATYTGDGCSYSPGTGSSPAPTGAKDGCPTGQQASMNGVTVCQTGIDPATNVVQSVKTSTSSTGTVTTNADGTTSTSGCTVVQGGTSVPCPTTQQTTVTCAGDSCTVQTVTTQTNADGSKKTDTTTATEAKADVCAKSPKDPNCTQQSKFSVTDCATPPTCTGDAVACATAAYAFKTQCQLQDPKSSEQALYDAERGKTGDQTAVLATNRAFGITGSTFDQTDLIGNPQGVADLTTSVMGNPVTIKLSLVNPWLVVLGDVLMALTALVCLRVVFRSE